MELRLLGLLLANEYLVRIKHEHRTDLADFEHSCLGCWCPCILYGKTQARNDGDPNSSGLGLMV